MLDSLCAGGLDSLASQFNAALHLKSASPTLPPGVDQLSGSSSWGAPQPGGPHSAGKDQGQALLKLLQSGSGGKDAQPQQAALGQPAQQHHAQQQQHQQQAALPGLSLSFLNGASAVPPAELGGAGAGLFASPNSSGMGAPDPAQQPLPSLFSGNSIWSTSGSDSAGAATSLWGGSSIWSSQGDAWVMQPPAQELMQQQHGLAPGSQALRGLPSQLLSPRHPQHQPSQQFNAAMALPHPGGPGQLQLRQPPQQLGGFPQPPGFPPHPSHQYQQQQQHAALGFAGDHMPYHSQPPPYGVPPHGFGPDFSQLGMAPAGGLLGGQRMPPPHGAPPPPPPGHHAPKFAPHTQQQHQQQQGPGGLPMPADDRAKLPPHMPQQQQQQQAVGPGSRAAPQQQYPHAKVMRHQQLKQAGGSYTNHYSPKHVNNRESSRWVEVMDRGHAGRLPRSDMAQLDARLLTLMESLMPTPEEQQRQRVAFERVKEVLQRQWPHARVHLFGSVANGLSVRSNNDLDVCLEMEDVGDDQAAKGEVATELGDVLREAGMSEVLPLPKARVPVVKFVVPETGTKVDVTVNNMLACLNTKLLSDYCAIDPRLAQLVAVVKHWAKQRAVNDSYRGTLSSYCYVLMCIHLLQTRTPPVMPALQQMPPTFRREVGQWKVEYFDQVESLRDFGSDNNESLSQLVWSFFEYWAWRHDYSSDVISVRTGGFLRKEDKDWTRRIGNERHLVCIEDPFELSHDLGRTVDRQTKSVLHKEFIRAATLLRDAADPLDRLFEPYRAGRA